MNMTYEAGFQKIYSSLSILRGTIYDYRVFLVILSLYKNRCFRDEIGAYNDSILSKERIEKALSIAALNDESGRAAVLFDVYRIYERSFPHYLVASIFHVLSEIEDEWYSMYFTRLFEDLLKRIEEVNGRMRGEMSQPSEITQVVSFLCQYDGGSFYNPFAGTAYYCIDFCVTNNYYAQEINSYVWGIGVLCLLAHDMPIGGYRLEDSTNHWLAENRKFDFIVSTPPFHSPIIRRDNHNPFLGIRYLEEKFLLDSMDSLSPKGQIACVLSPSVFISTTQGCQFLRRKMVDNGLIDTIVLLPSGVYAGRGDATVILHLNKMKKHVGKVRFVDGSAFFEKVKNKSVLKAEELIKAIQGEEGDAVKYVSDAEIRKGGYLLDPKRYFSEPLLMPSGYRPFKVSSVMSPYSGERVSDEGLGRVLGPASLSEDPFAWCISENDIPISDIPIQGRIIDKPVVVISKVRSPRATFVDVPAGSSFIINPNLLAFTFERKEVYLPMFLYELRSRADRELRNSLAHGLPTPSLLEFQLYLPPTVAEQEALFSKLERQDKLAKAKELGLESLLADQERAFWDTFRSRKHDLRNCLGAIRNNVSAFSSFLEDHELIEEPVNPNVSRTMGEQFARLKALLDKMDNQISRLTNNGEYSKPEIVNLYTKLASIVSDGNYKVEFSSDFSSMPEGSSSNPEAFVFINEGDFDRVIDNILVNAKKHGFKNAAATEYIVSIVLAYDSNDDAYIISFKNNGDPMPKNMDTRRYGIDGEKGDDSNGEGKGGAIVKNIIEHFKGQYEVVNDPEAIFPVEIILKLPRYDID